LKPVLVFLAQQGILLSVYIDDGRGLAGSKAKADDDYTLVVCILESAGLSISASKSDGPGESATSKEYLGFIVDTVQCLWWFQSTRWCEFLEP
jgi:hypothetical protein